METTEDVCTQEYRPMSPSEPLPPPLEPSPPPSTEDVCTQEDRPMAPSEPSPPPSEPSPPLSTEDVCTQEDRPMSPSESSPPPSEPSPPPSTEDVCTQEDRPMSPSEPLPPPLEPSPPPSTEDVCTQEDRPMSPSEPLPPPLEPSPPPSTEDVCTQEDRPMTPSEPSPPSSEPLPPPSESSPPPSTEDVCTQEDRLMSPSEPSPPPSEPSPSPSGPSPSPSGLSPLPSGPSPSPSRPSPSPSRPSPSPYGVRVAGEAQQGVYSPQFPPRHRRSQSEVITGPPVRNNSFQRLKIHMQKAWGWGGIPKEESYQSCFNLEVLANQKRQWYQLHSKTMDHVKYKEPTSLFEHFIVTGLHPDANLESVEDAFARRKKWESEMTKSEVLDIRMLQHRGRPLPTSEPQILFKYPPGKRLAMRPKDLAAFCFPSGVKVRSVERTPSLSDLNELVYGQEHLGRDDSSFIFSLKVADNATLYGICLHVSEIVQRPPGILGTSSPLPQSSGSSSRYLVSAPRCYCVLSRVPFFDLHYEMLNSLIAQERLNRITAILSEMSLTEFVPSGSKLYDPTNDSVDSPDREYFNDDMASAIPVDSALALTDAATGIISDDEIPSSSLKTWEPQSPESVIASEVSDISQLQEADKDDRKNSQYFDDCASEASENRSDNLERVYATIESGQASPDVGTFPGPRTRTLERLASSESLFSPARSMASDDDDDDLFSNCEKDFGDDLIMEWARENKNDLLQIVCGYHALPLPARGSEIVFQPLNHLQAIEYSRPPASAFGFCEKYLDSFEAAEVNAKLAAAEEALALSVWTTATICRVLSIESVLALVTGVLLEKQVVILCPNPGVLSAIVLSLIPMIRPFQWQSLLLPILPGKMVDFLDAPVPFIVGLQNKPADLKIKTSNLLNVYVLKDQVKMCNLPSLPRYKELVSELRPIHARLSYQHSIARKHPVYRCSEVQAEAATQFLNVMRSYMESLCSDLRSHTITNVQSNNDRVSLLLKDSFIGSFPNRDQPFIKHLVDTQLFSVLCDSRLSSFEHGYI